ncbi:MAG TPA: glycosyltransferase family 87 protein [Puia sp.]|nr:glycosyltransferase family 87 protein [Puia sp.]
MPPVRRYLWFIPLLLTLAFGLRRSWSSPPSDFAGYYYGGLALTQGHYSEAYDMTRLNDRIAADGRHDVLVSYAPFPPFSSLVFAPFLIFPMDVARLVFNCISITFFLFTLLRLTRYLSTPPWLILVLPVIFFIPLLNNLAFGQAYLLLFTLLGEGWLAYHKQQRILSSLLWAAAILFKLFPAFLFVFLLVRRRYRDAIYLGIGCILLLLPSLLINGIAAWNFYVFTILPRMNHGELNDSFTYVFQSAYMLLKRAFRYDQLLNPHPITDNPWLFTLSMAIFKSIILTPAVLLAYAARPITAPTSTAPTSTAENDDYFPFTAWIAASMLISPNGSSYSLVLLMLPTLALVAARPSRRAILAVILLTAACAIPVNKFGAFPLPAQFPRLYLLLLFYILLNRPRPHIRSLALSAALAALFFALDIRGNLPSKDPSSYVLTKEAHLFIDDYSARDNHLIYSWRDDKGPHEQQTDYPAHLLSIDSLTLKDNQIWYKGEQITYSSDRKAKPALAEGTDIIYLSDKDRGFEFYTLRKIGLGKITPH